LAQLELALLLRELDPKVDDSRSHGLDLVLEVPDIVGVGIDSLADGINPLLKPDNLQILELVCFVQTWSVVSSCALAHWMNMVWGDADEKGDGDGEGLVW